MILNAFGTIFLIIAPNKNSDYTKNGEPNIAFVGKSSDSGKSRFLFNLLANKIGWILLLAGFVLEVFDSYKQISA